MSKKVGLVTAIFQGDVYILIVCEVSKQWVFLHFWEDGTHCHKTVALPMDTVYLYKGQGNQWWSSEESLSRGNVEALEHLTFGFSPFAGKF